jgi:transposase
MNTNTIYVGMDVHKESFSLCCYSIEKDEASHQQKIGADYRLILKYLGSMRGVFGEDTEFVCGYEAGCLGFTLYRQLTDLNVKCIILAPTTMMAEQGRKRIKTDKRDAVLIARCLAYHTYHAVHIPTEQDEQIKEYIRMRDDHRLALKKDKQQILSFCLRHGFQYTETNSRWTQAHINWLRKLELEGLYQETMAEYLMTFDRLTEVIERLDKRIAGLAEQDTYRSNVKKLTCFMGVKTQTALAVLVEVGDFNRFARAENIAAYIGLVPGEDSSGGDKQRLSITKAGNTHVRRLLIEAAQSYSRGVVGYKSKALKERQEGNPPEVIAYADKANTRLRRRYYHMILQNGRKANVAKTAIARELMCFMWGMVTGNIEARI